MPFLAPSHDTRSGDLTGKPSGSCWTVAEELKKNQDIALLTLGDPSIYSTCMYIQNQIRAMGFSYQMVAGVPSFCAAAASLGESLTEADQPCGFSPPLIPVPNRS
ncbi:SAM-dependent methyltransferase [Anaeromassilibacillus sp. SJQ-1]|uniref:SAM-dependent methyltransferase n=1 Tax=Anaeromassilibacillus sp. SJQ-1 TaxID=3375419 RepID=UPI00398927A4